MTCFSNSPLMAILAAGLCIATGCSGGAKKPPAPPAVQNANAAPTAPVVPPPVVAQAGNPRDQAAEKSTNPAEGEPVEPPGVDDFVISTDQIVTEVENPRPKPPPPSFEVTSIPDGVDSTNLVIAGTAESSSPPGNGSPAVSTPPGTSGTSRTSLPATADAASQNTSKAASGDALTLPKGFTAATGSLDDPETGLPLRIRGDRDTVEMVLIRPGVFLRGADVADPVVSPRHTVLMEQPYYIDAVEVTVGRYNAFREFFRKSEGRKLDGSINHDDNPELPAVGIKFFDAKFYAKWAGKELPTETQWERAARGDRGFDFPWGEGRPVFHLPRVVGQLDPAATFPGDRSPFGVYDMAGNAREWCLDLYQADVYQKEIAHGEGTVRDPVGPKSAPGIKQQVIRGGRTDWAVWHRSALPQNETAPDLGFRCVLNLPLPTKTKTDKGTRSTDRPDKADKKPEDKKGATKF